MSETLRRVRMPVQAGDYSISRHGFRELDIDDISSDDLIAGVMAAVLLEDHPDGRKEPSVLTLQSVATIRAQVAFQAMAPPAGRRCWRK